MRTMTMRERLLATLRGEPHDQVPFAEYEATLLIDEVRQLLGPERIGRIRWTRIYRLDAPHCRFEEEPLPKQGLDGMRFTWHTPKGSMTRETLIDPTYGSHSTRKYYLQELADYDILDAYLDDVVVTFDNDPYQRDLRDVGDEGVVYMPVPRTPWQQLWVEWVNLEALSWHFADDEARVMRTVGKIERIRRDIYDGVSALKPELVDIPDNITAPAIGPERFARFCLPAYQDLAARVAEYDGSVICHTDGDLKPLWSLIGESGLTGLDSFSPQPDNDTSVAEAVAQWPDKSLWMNFPSSVHLYPPEEIREQAREILRQGGDTGRIAILLSENVPPYAWRTSLPIIAEELEAYGVPGCFR